MVLTGDDLEVLHVDEPHHFLVLWTQVELLDVDAADVAESDLGLACLFVVLLHQVFEDALVFLRYNVQVDSPLGIDEVHHLQVVL